MNGGVLKHCIGETGWGQQTQEGYLNLVCHKLGAVTQSDDSSPCEGLEKNGKSDDPSTFPGRGSMGMHPTG